MNFQIRSLSCVALLLVATTLTAAQEKTVPRYIEFRDGSVMRLPVVEQPWKLTMVLSTGKVDHVSLLPSQIQSLSLTAEQDFGKKQKLLSAVQQLGSDFFEEREQAYQTLHKMGPPICPDLKACLQLTTDVEIQARLQDLIAKLQPGDPKLIQSRVIFDSIVTKESYWGYLGDSPITVVVNNKQFSLGRKDVARISDVAPTSRSASLQRITENEFPPDCIEESFERDPSSNQPLKAGDNVEKMFVSRGLVLATAVKKSFISVNTFSVAGKSGGFSIANHEPLWEGEIIIRFVQPGKEYLPSAVNYFGCWIAAVVPDGTTFIAYDLQDRELGKILTKQHNTEFLGVKSDIPIHKIRITPNTELDTNFTLDDFIFRFAPTVQASHPDKLLVQSASGDSILCQDASIKGKDIFLNGLPAGLPDISMPLGKVVRINPPPQPAPPKKQEGLFAELADGSILFASEPEDKRRVPVFARYPDLLKERKGVVGIWSAKSGRKLTTIKPNQMILWDKEREQWQEVNYLRFLEELVLWKGADNKFSSSSYYQFSTIWFAPPKEKPEPGSWHVQTIHGEDLVLTQGQPFTGRFTEKVTFNWRGQTLQMPTSEIMSIYQVTKQP